MSEVRGSGREYQTDSAGTAETSYPASEVRGGGREEIPESEVRGGYQRSYPTSDVRGGRREELPHAPTPPRMRPGAAARRSNPTSKEPWLPGRRRA